MSRVPRYSAHGVPEFGARKGLRKCVKLESPGDPKIEHKSTRGAPKELPGGVPEVPSEEGRKKSGFWTPLTAENKVGAWTPARFPLFTRSLRRTPKWSQNGCPLTLKSYPRHPKDVSKDASEKSEKMSPKIKPKWKPMGTQRTPKNNQKSHPRRPHSERFQLHPKKVSK